MFNQVIKLITIKENINDNFELENQEASKEVFCEIKSIGQKEFYQAQSVGFKPEICFVISDYLDYNNEEYIEFNNVKYKVIRTYMKIGSFNLEIYVSKIIQEGENGST